MRLFVGYSLWVADCVVYIGVLLLFVCDLVIVRMLALSDIGLVGLVVRFGLGCFPVALFLVCDFGFCFAMYEFVLIWVWFMWLRLIV